MSRVGQSVGDMTRHRAIRSGDRNLGLVPASAPATVGVEPSPGGVFGLVVVLVAGLPVGLVVVWTAQQRPSVDATTDLPPTVVSYVR